MAPARAAGADDQSAGAHRQQAGQMIEDLAELKFRNAQGKNAPGLTSTPRAARRSDLLVAKDLSKTLGGNALFSIWT